MPVSVLVGFFGFSSKKVMRPLGVQRDGVVFLDLLQVADVIDRQHRGVLLAAEPAEVRQLLAEQVVARDDDDVVVHVLGLQDEMDVADGAELVGVVGRAVVDDGEVELGLVGAVIRGPLLEVAGELGVGDDVNAVNAADGREVVEHVVDHRLAGDRQQRFGLRERERIKAGGVTGR